MSIRPNCWLLIIVLLLMIYPVRAQGQQTLTITNNSFFRVCGLYALEGDSDDLGANLLAADDSLFLDESRTVTVPETTTRIAAVTCFGYGQAFPVNLRRSSTLQMSFRTGDASTDFMLNMMAGFARNQSDHGKVLIDLFDSSAKEALGISGDRSEAFQQMFGSDSSLNFAQLLQDQMAQNVNPLELFQLILDFRNLDGELQSAMNMRDKGDLYGAIGVFDSIAERMRKYQNSLLGSMMGKYVLGVALYMSGSIRAEVGDYDKAIPLLQESLLTEESTGQYIYGGYTLTNLAGLYYTEGDFAHTIDALNRAYTIQSSIGNKGGTILALNNLGTMYLNLNLSSEAAGYYQEALALWATVSPEDSSIIDRGRPAGVDQTLHINLGQAYLQLAQYDKALAEFEQARDSAQNEIATAAPDARLRDAHSSLAFAYFDIGQVQAAQQDYAAAELSYQAALDENKPLNLPDQRASLLLGFATLYIQEDHSNQAMTLLRQAVEQAQTVQSRVTEAQAWWLIGNLNSQSGDFEPALEPMRKARDLADQVLLDAGFDRAVAGTLGYLSRIYQDLSISETLSGDIDAGITDLERGRAVLIRSELMRVPVDVRASATHAQIEQGNELLNAAKAAQDHLTWARTAQSDTHVTADAEDSLAQAQLKYQQYLETIQGTASIAQEYIIQPASVKAMQAALPPDTTLLLYSLSDAYGFVYVISPDGEPVPYQIQGNADQVRDALTRLRANYNDEKAQRDLYDLVFSTLEGKISTRRIMIAPDGVLNYVPFAALRTPDNKFLIDHYSISMIPSGTALVLLNRRPVQTAQRPALVLAQSRAPGQATLPQAQSEAEAIAGVLGVTPNLDASESDLRTGVAGSAILSISAHADFNPASPLFSAVDLKADGANDGLLQTREVYELDLSQGTNLVILSGCDTGVGGAGDDFAEMNRAFLAAGANAVVSSQWTVNDASTSALMTAFIQARAHSDNDADALRAAMLSIRADARYSSPQDWASFSLTGLSQRSASHESAGS